MLLERWLVAVSALIIFSLVQRSEGQVKSAVLQCYNCMYTDAITEVGAQCLNPASIATSQLDPTIVQVIGCGGGQCFVYDIVDHIGAHTTIRGCMQAQTQFQCAQQGVTCCATNDLCNNLDTTPITNQNLICYQCQYTNAGGIDQNIGCLAPNSNANAAASANVTNVQCPGSCFTSVTVANDLVTQVVTRGCTTYQPQYNCAANTCCTSQQFCNGNSMAYIPPSVGARPSGALFVLLVAAVSAFSF